MWFISLRRNRERTIVQTKQVREENNNGTLTVQTFNSCTSRLDVCQCLVVQTPMNNVSHVVCESKIRLVLRSSCIYAKDTGGQSGVWSCVMPGQPTHLVQELNVGTVSLAVLASAMKITALQRLKRAAL